MFTSRSNGRIHCYKCVPANSVGSGRGKKFSGKVSGMLTKEKEAILEAEMGEEEKIISLCVSHANEIEAAARVVPTRYQLGPNAFGDRVVMYGRPDDGWGKCAHTDSMTAMQECIKEKFFEATPFCYEHIRVWRDVQARRMAAKLAGTHDTVHRIPAKDFNIGSAKDAVVLLGKISSMIEKGQMTVMKAEAIARMVTVQLTALRQRKGEEKLMAEIKLLLERARRVRATSGEDEDSKPSPEEEEELRQLAERHGISEDTDKPDGK